MKMTGASLDQERRTRPLGRSEPGTPWPDQTCTHGLWPEPASADTSDHPHEGVMSVVNPRFSSGGGGRIIFN